MKTVTKTPTKIRVRVTPILGAIPDEIYPEINAGYEYGQPVECVVSEDEVPTDDDSQIVEWLGFA